MYALGKGNGTNVLSFPIFCARFSCFQLCIKHKRTVVVKWKWPDVTLRAK